MYGLYNAQDWASWWLLFRKLGEVETQDAVACFFSRQDATFYLEFATQTAVPAQLHKLKQRNLPAPLREAFLSKEPQRTAFVASIWELFHAPQEYVMLVLPTEWAGEAVGCLVLFAEPQEVNRLTRWLASCLPIVQRSMANLLQTAQMVRRVEELQRTIDSLDLSGQQMHQNAVDFMNSQKQLMASLQYAKKIQNALLPSETLFAQSFEECFIYYQPKDTVSGDFYWFSQLDYTFVAVVDCTGHGVPGAFMGMIGNTLLNEIINVKRHQEPAHILRLLDAGIQHTLNQEATQNPDGMDIGLCRFERDAQFNLKLVFAGAKNNLHIYQHRAQTFQCLRGYRTNIGGVSQQVKQFEQIEWALEEGDILYMMTDGMTDACNQQRKPFGWGKLQKLLLAHIHEPLVIQKRLLVETLKAYQGDTPQRDDMTMVAVKP